MGRIHLVSDEEAAGDPVLTALFEGTRELGGRVPNSSRTYANLPLIAVWQAAFTGALQRQGGGGKLDGRTKEMAVLKTSMVNACDYCVTHNRALGQATGLTVEEIDAIAGDYAASDLLSPRDKAVVRWAEAVTLNQAQRDKKSFEALAGFFDDAEILEITWLSAMFNMLNRVHDSLQIDPEPENEVDLIRRSKIVSVDQICTHVTRAVEAIRTSEATPRVAASA